MTVSINYTPEPTAARFHADDRFFRVLKGPVGVGKSSACVVELLMRALKQEPFNGVRKSRWVIIRDTYGNLKQTTIATTFKLWLPESVCHLSGDTPIHGTFSHNLNDGTKVEAEFIFLALDRPEDTEKLQGLEVTGAWLNEASRLNEEIFKFLRGRVGRYPSKTEGGPTWKGIIADTNPPETTHWIYRLFEQEQHHEFKMFTCPPAIYFDAEEQKWVPNPDAENLQWLPVDYYRQQIAGNTEDYIRVMLAGEYGMTRKGKPVFPQFSERLHVASEPLHGDRGMPLIIGIDFGLSPAAVFAQVNAKGGLMILDSLSPTGEMLDTFIEEYVLPLINKKYARYKIQCVGDPAGGSRSDLQKATRINMMRDYGIPCIPAITNLWPPRKEAVDHFLSKIDGLKIDPRLTQIRNGFGGGYIYGKIDGDSTRTKERPEKNEYSHAMDAIQYIALHVRRASGSKIGKRHFDAPKKEERFLWA